MSSSFSANQYASAFKSNKLQNWTVPKHYKERPSAAEGHTTFIATDRGHLLPGVKHGSAWTSFKGTWDLPSHIPPVHINPTARSQKGQERLRTWGQVQCLDPLSTGRLHETHGDSMASSHSTPRNENINVDQLHGQIPVSTPAPDGPEPERPVSQASPAQSRPATQQSHAESRPASKRSQAESRPLTHASQAQSRPATQTSRASNVQTNGHQAE